MRFLCLLSAAFIVLAGSGVISSNAVALSDNYLDKFANNNIMFYNPEECMECQMACSGSDGSNITVVGDAILADAVIRGKIKEQYAQLDDSSYNAEGKRTWDQGIATLGSMTLKEIVIFELGSYDANAITAAQLNSLLSKIGTNRTLVLITPYSADSTKNNTLKSTTNQLKSTAGSNQQIKLVDWANSASNANVTLNDGAEKVVPTSDSEKDLYAQGITGAIGGSCNSGKAVVSGKTAEEKVWSGFKSLGLTDEVVAGLMGNIEIEGIFNPANWEKEKKTYWDQANIANLCKSNPNRIGMGLVGFTSTSFYCILNDYYKANAPDLIQYLEQPYKFGQTDKGRYCNGTDCFLKKIDEGTANRLYSTQITIIYGLMTGEYQKKYNEGKRYKDMINQKTVEDAAFYWLHYFENPRNPEQSRSGRVNNAKKWYDKFHGQTTFEGGSSTGGTTGTNCGQAKATTAFKKYNFTDAQLKGILAVAEGENGSSLAALKSELSLMANKAEKSGANDENGFINYIKQTSVFSSGDAYKESYNPKTSNALTAAKDILNGGNRTLAPQLTESDCFDCGDITEATTDGKAIDKNDKTKYEKKKTKIKGKSGEEYFFYAWSDTSNSGGRILGFKEGNTPDKDFNASKTAAASSAKSTVDIKVSSDGWISGGLIGFTKATPESGGLEVTDSSHTLDYETSKADGTVGANKITLLSTESGNASIGDNGLGAYTSSKTPPHFTVDMKNKRVYQHYPITKPATALNEVDTTAGIQIAVVGYAKSDKSSDKWYLPNSANFTDAEWQYLAKLIYGISKATGISMASTVDWANPKRLSSDEFKSYSGIIGHMHAPSNSAKGPGNIWDMLSKPLNNLQTLEESDECGGGNATITEFEWWGQSDSRWGGKNWGTESTHINTISLSGCGCTSIAMITSTLTGTAIYPDEMCIHLGKLGDHVKGGSTANVGWHGARYSNEKNKANGKNIELEWEMDNGHKYNAEQLSAKLREGWMIWMCGKKHAVFSEKGHCIGIRGITASGRWLVADPKGHGKNPSGKRISLEQDWDGADILQHNGSRTLIRVKR